MREIESLDLFGWNPEAKPRAKVVEIAPPTGKQVRAEHVKRKSNREVLRSILESGGWHSNSALTLRCGYRYGARLHELRLGTGMPGGVPLVVHRRCDALGLYLFRGDPKGEVLADCDCPHCIGRQPTEKGEVKP